MQSSITCRKVFVISLSYKNILSIYRMRMKIRRWARRQMEGHTTRAFKGSWFQVTIYLMWLCEVMAMGKVSQRYSSVNSTSSLYKLLSQPRSGEGGGWLFPVQHRIPELPDQALARRPPLHVASRPLRCGLLQLPTRRMRPLCRPRAGGGERCKGS